MITQELIAQCFEYKDGLLYWKGVTHPNKQCLMDKPAGSIHKTGYRHITWMGKVHKAHRLIFMLHHGLPWLPPASRATLRRSVAQVAQVPLAERVDL